MSRNRVVNFTKTGKRVRHGTVGGYTNHHCRCALCRSAFRVNALEWSHRTGYTRPLQEVLAERRAAVQHGSSYMYQVIRCRCAVCVEGARTQRAREREKQRSKPIPRHVHGTTNGYQNYGCRCALCSEASREDGRARYQKRKAAL